MSDIRLPIKVVVDHSVEEPTLLLRPQDYVKLQDILMREEYELEAWKFQRIMNGLSSK